MMARNRFTLASISCLALVSLRSEFVESLAVSRQGLHQISYAARYNRPWNRGNPTQSLTRKSSRSIHMLTDDVIPMAASGITFLSKLSTSAVPPSSFIPQTSESLLASTPSNMLTATTQILVSNPQMEAELLTDVSHVAMDLTGFLGPKTVWLRFCNVIGRILILSSDYIQDNYITPDEIFFQVFMLAVSCNLFLRSVWPLILAAFTTTTLSVRDGKAFTLLFDSVGLTVLQFRTLIASSTLDWIEVTPEQEIELNGDYMYWLYAGSASSGGEHSDASFSKDSLNEKDDWLIGNRMFGEIQFAKALEASMVKDNSKSKSGKKEPEAENSAASSTIVNGKLKAGTNGATFLRISTSKLLDLMKNDDQLSGSIHRLVLLCMQEKLSRSLGQESRAPHFSSSNSSTKSNVYQTSFSTASITNATDGARSL